MPMPPLSNGDSRTVTFTPPTVKFRKGTKEGGGSYYSTDDRFYVIRNEDKYWVWGYNRKHDSQGNPISATNGDDEHYITKTDCVRGLEKFLFDEAYDNALWEN